MSTPVILHLRLDDFQAEAEMFRRPELRDVPVLVGGGSRGVVLAANGRARESGVHQGMPTMRARRLCPDVVTLSPDPDHYANTLDAVAEIMGTLSDRVEMAGADRAFVDVTGALRRMGLSSDGVAEWLRARIADEQGLPSSVGVGPSRFIAALGAEAAAPDGAMVIGPDEVISFLHPQPVEAIRGVGPATAEKLRRLGMSFVRDVANTPRHTLQRAFGDDRGALLADLSWGRDVEPVIARVPTKDSIGAQETFARDVDDPEVVHTEILRMAERAASRMRARQVVGRVVRLVIRFADLSSITRTGTLTAPTDLTGDIHSEAMRLFRRLNLQRARIRSVAVRVAGLTPRGQTHVQPALDEAERGWAEAETAMDGLVWRFGPKALRRARLTRCDVGSAGGDEV